MCIVQLNTLFISIHHSLRPTDTEFMFDTFLAACKDPKAPVQFPVRKLAPKVGNVKKILLLGSGGTSIGQAGEFEFCVSRSKRMMNRYKQRV